MRTFIVTLENSAAFEKNSMHSISIYYLIPTTYQYHLCNSKIPTTYFQTVHSERKSKWCHFSHFFAIASTSHSKQRKIVSCCMYTLLWQFLCFFQLIRAKPGKHWFTTMNRQRLRPFWHAWNYSSIHGWFGHSCLSEASSKNTATAEQ